MQCRTENNDNLTKPRILIEKILVFELYINKLLLKPLGEERPAYVVLLRAKITYRWGHF